MHKRVSMDYEQEHRLRLAAEAVGAGDGGDVMRTFWRTFSACAVRRVCLQAHESEVVFFLSCWTF